LQKIGDIRITIMMLLLKPRISPRSPLTKRRSIIKERPLKRIEQAKSSKRKSFARKGLVPSQEWLRTLTKLLGPPIMFFSATTARQIALASGSLPTPMSTMAPKMDPPGPVFSQITFLKLPLA